MSGRASVTKVGDNLALDSGSASAERRQRFGLSRAERTPVAPADNCSRASARSSLDVYHHLRVNGHERRRHHGRVSRDSVDVLQEISRSLNQAKLARMPFSKNRMKRISTWTIITRTCDSQMNTLQLHIDGNHTENCAPHQ